MARHELTFRGEAYEIPAGQALCTTCGELLTIEAWLVQDCVGRPSPACTCPEHDCVPDRGQQERYPVAGYSLCSRCYAMGHAAPLRLQYAGLLP